GGKTSSIKDVSINTSLTLKEDEQKTETAKTTDDKHSSFKDITASSKINFVHKENDFIDFKDEVLLPWQLSRYGPALAVADINNDGLDDFFAGGAIGQLSVVYVQNADGTFHRTAQPDIEKDKESEDVNAVFFDANNDGYKDLYVVSGGNEYEDTSPEYQDRL